MVNLRNTNATIQNLVLSEIAVVAKSRLDGVILSKNDNSNTNVLDCTACRLENIRVSSSAIQCGVVSTTGAVILNFARTFFSSIDLVGLDFNGRSAIVRVGLVEECF